MWKLHDEKITAYIQWNILPIVQSTPRGGVLKLCLTEEFRLLKHFHDEYILNKKSEQCRLENKMLVKGEKKKDSLVVLALLYYFSFYSYIFCVLV